VSPDLNEGFIQVGHANGVATTKALRREQRRNGKGNAGRHRQADHGAGVS